MLTHIKERMMNGKRRNLWGLAVAMAAGMTSLDANAAVLVNLRLADGSSERTLTGFEVSGTTIAIDVYATVTGAPGNAAPEGFQGFYFGALTSTVSNGIDGDLTNIVLLAPFAATGGSNGTFQSLGADQQTDLGGTSQSVNTGWARAYAGAGVFVAAGGTAVPNGTEFKVATLTYTLNTVNPLAPGSSVTITPTFPSQLLASTRATWQQDGNQVNAGTAGTGGYNAGSAVTLMTVIPEPTSLGLLGLASAGLLARRRRTAAC